MPSTNLIIHQGKIKLTKYFLYTQQGLGSLKFHQGGKNNPSGRFHQVSYGGVFLKGTK